MMHVYILLLCFYCSPQAATVYISGMQACIKWRERERETPAVSQRFRGRREQDSLA